MGDDKEKPKEKIDRKGSHPGEKEKDPQEEGSALILDARTDLDEKSIEKPIDFEGLPPLDLFYILEWRYDTRIKPFFNYVYDEYKKDYPSIAEGYFLEQIKRSSTQKILILLQKYAPKEVKKDFNEAQRIVESPEFAKEFTYLKKKFGIDNARAPYYEVYFIFRQNDIEKRRILEALKTEEFAEFHKMLQVRYSINPNNRISRTADIYLFPKTLDQLESPETQEEFRILCKYFPDLPRESVDTIFLVEKIKRWDDKGEFAEFVASGRYEQAVKEKARIYNLLKQIYGNEVKSSSDWEEMLELESDGVEVERLFNKTTQELWQFFKVYYPEKVDYKNFYELIDLVDGLPHLAEPFIEMGEQPATIDAYLKIFGKSLGSIKFEAYPFRDSRDRVDFVALAKDQKFKAYVDQLFTAYPDFRASIQSGDIDEIAAITRSYLLYPRTKELNVELARLKKLRIPDLAGEHADLKIAILRKFWEQGFDKIVPTESSFSSTKGIDWSRGDRECFEKTLRLIDNGEAKMLYSALINNWKFVTLELGGFLEILNGDEERQFFLDPENARRFLEIKEKYDLVARYSDNKEPIEINSLRDSYAMEDIVKAYDFLSNEANKALLQKYYPTWFQQSQKGRITIEMYQLKRLAEFKGIRNPQFPEIARIMEQEYQVAPRDIGELVGDDEIPENYLATIKSPQFREAFTWVTNFYSHQKRKNRAGKEKDFDAADLFLYTMHVYRYPRAEGVFRNLHVAGVKLNDAAAVIYVAKHILPQENVSKNIGHPQFPGFYKKITDTFYGETKDFEAIAEIAELFATLQERPSQMGVLFSPRFQETLSFIRREFNITDLHSSTLLPILRIAERFDEKKYQDIVAKLKAAEEKPTANDLLLIGEVTQDAKLETLLFSRNRLTAALEPTYALPVSDRIHLDQLVALKANLQFAEDHDQLNRARELRLEIQELEKNYTERPPREELSNLQLLRLNLLQASLRDPDTLGKIGSIVSRDIKDTSTEYGGNVFLRNSKLVFNAVRSFSEFDGAYATAKYKFFTDGIATFHLHALEKDTGKFSGPSGWLQARGGDIPYVDLYNSTDIVITTMGHPKDKAGNEIQNKLIVNVDMYYVDKRKPGQKKARIIDMGQHIVPV